MSSHIYKKVSIVIPVYNESRTIDNVVKKVVASNTFDLYKEIIVVDDASTDDTLGMLEECERDLKNLQSYGENVSIAVIRNDKNIGKTQALKKGILASKGDILIVQDADLEYDPCDFVRLLSPFIDHDADAVFGSRFAGGQAKRILYFWHTVGNKFLTLFSNMCSNLNLSDMESGYKSFRGDLIRKIAPTLSSGGFGFEPEITAKIAKIQGIRLYEVGINYWGRTYSEGKKIRWSDGVYAIWQVIYFNLLDKKRTQPSFNRDFQSHNDTSCDQANTK